MQFCSMKPEELLEENLLQRRGSMEPVAKKGNKAKNNKDDKDSQADSANSADNAAGAGGAPDN